MLYFYDIVNTQIDAIAKIIQMHRKFCYDIVNTQIYTLEKSYRCQKKAYINI